MFELRVGGNTVRDTFILKSIGSKTKVMLTKEELASTSKEELQDRLNQFIRAGYISPNTTVDDIEVYESPKHRVKPVAYMTSEMSEQLLACLEDRSFLQLGLLLKSLIKVVDDETMERIQQLVEKEESK